MKQNHFIYSYFGNKRTEVKNITDNINLDGITTIIEPFCGSSALSYYISTQCPNKFKYILNDNDKHLIEIYKVMQNDKRLDELLNWITNISKTLTREEYLKFINEDTLQGYFLKNSIYNIRKGLYPIDCDERHRNRDYMKKKKSPIINFLKNEQVELINGDGIDIIEKYKDNKECLIFLDPPYLLSNNNYYDDIEKGSNKNVYEYLLNNNFRNWKSYMVCCLENNWMIKLLFKGCVRYEYEKCYASSKKRKTTHLVITNK